jgi:hypothetical protein
MRRQFMALKITNILFKSWGIHKTLFSFKDPTKDEDYAMPHPIWSREESESVKIDHRKPEGFADHMARNHN